MTKFAYVKDYLTKQCYTVPVTKIHKFEDKVHHDPNQDYKIEVEEKIIVASIISTAKSKKVLEIALSEGRRRQSAPPARFLKGPVDTTDTENDCPSARLNGPNKNKNDSENSSLSKRLADLQKEQKNRKRQMDTLYEGKEPEGPLTAKQKKVEVNSGPANCKNFNIKELLNRTGIVDPELVRSTEGLRRPLTSISNFINIETSTGKSSHPPISEKIVGHGPNIVNRMIDRRNDDGQNKLERASRSNGKSSHPPISEKNVGHGPNIIDGRNDDGQKKLQRVSTSNGNSSHPRISEKNIGHGPNIIDRMIDRRNDEEKKKLERAYRQIEIKNSIIMKMKKQLQTNRDENGKLKNALQQKEEKYKRDQGKTNKN